LLGEIPNDLFHRMLVGLILLCMHLLSGRAGWFPSEVLSSLHRVVTRLGIRVAGDDVVLVALAQLPSDSLSWRALESAGAPAGQLFANLDLVPERSDHGSGFSLPPSVIAAVGWARGYDAARGVVSVSAEGLLLGLMWDPAGLASQLLHRIDVGREAVVEALVSLGAPRPLAPLPHQQEVELGEKVVIEAGDMDRVRVFLEATLTEDTTWGFSVSGDGATVVAGAGIPLAGLVEQALRES
jgi:hypothetical protein